MLRYFPDQMSTWVLDGFVIKRFSRVRFPIILLTFVVGLVIIAAAVALERTRHADYWIGVAGLLAAVILPLAAKVVHDRSESSPDHLNKIVQDLAEAVLRQWERNVARISDPYPLQVPFSVMTTAVADPADFHPETGKKAEGKKRSKSDALARMPPPDGPVTIMDSWASIRDQCGAQPLVLDGAFEDITTVFATDGLHGRMVILGEPGSGKSMIAQWLTVHMLQSQPEKTMVPVFMSLATWDPAEPLEEWAAAEMAKTYPALKTAIQATGYKECTEAYHLIVTKRVLMVLDGLDEMATGNQRDALHRLSEFARGGQHFVVTCRTSDYARIVYHAGAPLARTPVIALGALAMDDVIQYLKDTNLLQGSSAGRWDGLLEHLVTEPDGPLAIAMTSPLVVWLVRTNYARPETQPDDLLEWSSAEEVTDFLLDGLVDAAYSIPVFKKDMEMYAALDPEDRQVQEERLVYFADYVSKQNAQGDSKTAGRSKAYIEWWYLPRAVPAWFVAGTVGLVSGCLLGASGSMAATIKFGHTVGLIVGIVLGIAVAVHAGRVSVRWQDVPRAVDFSARLTFPRFARCLAVGLGVAVCFGYAADHGGGLIPALVSAVVMGPLCGVAIKPTFGFQPALGTGISAALGTGLAASLFGHGADPLVCATTTGLVFLVGAWVFTGIFQDTTRMKAVSPESLLRGDRNGSLIVALTAGIAFAVIFGLPLGPLVGFQAFAGFTVTAAFTVSMWGAFTITRIWLALFCKMPIRIMSFLHEADSRGVMRREGGAFQFRHFKLQERLAVSGSQTALVSAPPSQAEA